MLQNAFSFPVHVKVTFLLKGYISYFCCCNQIMTRNFIVRSYFGSQCQDIVHSSTEGIEVGEQRDWSHCILSLEVDSREKAGQATKPKACSQQLFSLSNLHLLRVLKPCKNSAISYRTSSNHMSLWGPFILKLWQQ